MSKMSIWPEWLPRIAAESFIVVLSVLLALAVDGWRETRALDRQVRAARAAFVAEMAGNRSLLQSEWGRPYHNRMWDFYKKVGVAYAQSPAGAEAVLNEGSSNFNTGVHPPPLRDAVWRSLSQGDLIRHMKLAEVFVLADIYREQEQLDVMFKRMLDVWLEPTPYKDDPRYKKDDAHVTRMFLADVVAAEGRLLERYNEGLALLADSSDMRR